MIPYVHANIISDTRTVFSFVSSEQLFRVLRACVTSACAWKGNIKYFGFLGVAKPTCWLRRRDTVSKAVLMDRPLLSDRELKTFHPAGDYCHVAVHPLAASSVGKIKALRWLKYPPRLVRTILFSSAKNHRRLKHETSL